jgi:hypothetical protein
MINLLILKAEESEKQSWSKEELLIILDAAKDIVCKVAKESWQQAESQFSEDYFVDQDNNEQCTLVKLDKDFDAFIEPFITKL